LVAPRHEVSGSSQQLLQLLQQERTTKAVKPASRVPAAASQAGVRKSMRFLPFDAAHGESVHDERSLNDAADASAWLLESGQLF
jgi:hypothetical protein